MRVHVSILSRQVYFVNSLFRIFAIFRKFFATEIYVNNNYNIILVQQLLQHSSAAITQRYIGISSKELEDALAGHIELL